MWIHGDTGDTNNAATAKAEKNFRRMRDTRSFCVRRFPEVSIDSRTIFLHFSFLSLTFAVLDIICYLSAKLIPVMMRRDRNEDDLHKMRIPVVPNDQATS